MQQKWAKCLFIAIQTLLIDLLLVQILNPVWYYRWEFCRSMRESTNTYVPRDVSRDKRGKFCKRLKGFKTKINKMNVENFAVFFVRLAFIELSFTVASF